jgi:hypothetical protein
MQQSTFPIIMNLLLHSSHFCVNGAASFWCNRSLSHFIIWSLLRLRSLRSTILKKRHHWNRF